MTTTEELIAFIKDLVKDATTLKDKYTDQKGIKVNYACVFAHDDNEYKRLYNLALQLGPVIKQTEMGDLFHITPFQTVSGPLQLIKVRKPDPSKFERGYADFTVPDYGAFKQKYLRHPRFKLTGREGYEMIGLAEKTVDVRVYFAFPPMDEQLGLV